jgi:hypothetical protein
MECPPSRVNTEEDIQKIAANNYRDADGHAFPFPHCVEVLHQLPKFNPLVDDADRSSDFSAEDSDGDKKPAASVNKTGAPRIQKGKKGVAFERHELFRFNYQR